MRNMVVRSRPLAVGLAALAVLATSGCAGKVNQDVYEADIAAIRADIAGLDSRASLTEEQLAEIQLRVDGLEAALGMLRDDFDVTVTRLETGLRFATPIHFDYDDATIRLADIELLDRFVDVVSNHFDGALITVEGFADPAGSVAYNQDLSERRATAVAQYVQADGTLDGAQIRTIGFGETRLVESGASGPGDAGLVNRRVAFVIDYAPESEMDSEDLVIESEEEDETT
jgi:peptidoglycan-associated lipoprotein